jgi:hypothetical protein
VFRASLPRGSASWNDATTTLETLNDQVRHYAATGSLPPEPLGNEVDLELDSRPEEDLAFRDSVITCVRQTLLAQVTEGLAARSVDRLDTSEATVRATRSLIDRVEARLRVDYPSAVLDAWSSNRTTISLIAERDGLVA